MYVLQRIALFSLGTLAMYQSCRDRILAATKPSISDVIRSVKESMADDETSIKYIARLRQKIKGPPLPL